MKKLAKASFFFDYFNNFHITKKTFFAIFKNAIDTIYLA